MKAIIKSKYTLFFAFVLGIGVFVSGSGYAQTAHGRITLTPAVTATPNPYLQKHSALPFSQLDVYDHGDPTPEEQYELELINRARANPPVEGNLLFSTTDPVVVNQYQQWGTPTRAQVKADFATYGAQPPLAFNKDLITAARRHSQDMLDHNYQEHNSPIDNSTPFTRMNDAGYVGYSFAGENIFAYGSNPDEINQEFEIDFGNPGLGHRENLINFGNYVYTEVGLGMIHGTGSGGINGGTGGPNAGPIITTEDFGSINGNVFITGVVYGDDNKNNFYDIGEGLSGVTITVTGGSTSAVSSTSGGYAIPYTDQGTVTVTASGGPLTTPISHNVTLNGENVKVDFVQGKTGFPEQPILIAPIADTLIHTDTAHFSWTKSAGETKYWIQLATDNKMTKLVLKDTAVTAATRVFPVAGGKEKALVDGTTYYWEVKSKNVIGWGKFSTIDSFVVGLPLKAVTLLSPANNGNVSPDNDISFSWKNTIPEASDYWIEVSTSATMANPIHSDTLYPYPDTIITYPSADFLPSMKYYWRVRGENENGLGLPSAIWSFTTAASSVSGGDASSLATYVTPNPTSAETHIRFSVSRSADVSLKVFGVTGNEVSHAELGRLEPKNYDVIWDGSKESSGVYLYELAIGDKRETGRIIVSK